MRIEAKYSPPDPSFWHIRDVCKNIICLVSTSEEIFQKNPTNKKDVFVLLPQIHIF
jgi:hypothetical protein